MSGPLEQLAAETAKRVVADALWLSELDRKAAQQHILAALRQVEQPLRAELAESVNQHNALADMLNAARIERDEAKARADFADLAEQKARADVERLERSELELIDERDRAEEWADRLAYAIGGEAIGEHSSANNPWQNALEEAGNLKAENERLRGVADELAKDKERLDWLIKQGPPGATDGIGLNEYTWESACGVVDDCCRTDSECVRLAIDAALAKYEGGGE